MINWMISENMISVFHSSGKDVTFASKHPGYTRAKQILMNTELVQTQKWDELLELLSDPLSVVSTWFASSGVNFDREGDRLVINDSYSLNMARWLSLIDRLIATKCSAQILQNLFMDTECSITLKCLMDLDSSNVCLVQTNLADSKLETHLCVPVRYKSGLKIGATFTGSSLSGDVYLCKILGFSVNDDGLLIPLLSQVLYQLGSHDDFNGIKPAGAIRGSDNTFQCFEGMSDGWYVDIASDSLSKAMTAYESIIAAGGEAKVVNTISLLSIT